MITYASRSHPLKEHAVLLKKFMALPPVVEQAHGTLIDDGESRWASVILLNSAGRILNPEVLGEQDFLRLFCNWLRCYEEQRTTALLYRCGENAALYYLYYSCRGGLERSRWVIWRDDLPIPEPRLKLVV